MELDRNQLEAIIKNAIAEDLGSGDITSQSIIPNRRTGEAIIIAKAKGILAGNRVARMVFESIDNNLVYKEIISDGAWLERGAEIATVKGSVRSILAGERVALNFTQHLSGIATLTGQFVEKIKDYPVKILDTRKTLPGLRRLEKYAVRMGGGHNHRAGLYDEILIKDNHITAGGGITPAVEAVRKKYGGKQTIEVETKSLDEVNEALAAGADTIMLDNMTIKVIKTAVQVVAEWNKHKKKKVKTEASGGVTMHNIRNIARSGVDLISVGALTHSAPVLDISLEFK